MLSRQGSEQPQRVSSEKGPLLTSSVPLMPHRRGPGPVPGVAASVSTGLSCCGGFPLAIRLPRAQHICSAHLCSQLPQLELGPPPQVQLCWSCPVSQQSGSAVPWRPALPQAAGCVLCGPLPSLANEGPSVQVHPTERGTQRAGPSCWALVRGLGGPRPPASCTSTVFGLLGGTPTPSSAHL